MGLQAVREIQNLLSDRTLRTLCLRIPQKIMPPGSIGPACACWRGAPSAPPAAIKRRTLSPRPRPGPPAPSPMSLLRAMQQLSFVGARFATGTAVVQARPAQRRCLASAARATASADKGLSKGDLIKEVSAKTGLDDKKAATAVNAVIETIETAVASGEAIGLRRGGCRGCWAGETIITLASSLLPPLALPPRSVGRCASSAAGAPAGRSPPSPQLAAPPPNLNCWPARQRRGSQLLDAWLVERSRILLSAPFCFVMMLPPS